MEAFCTYCSKDKSREPGTIPAIERYASQRIKSIYASALSVGEPFFILSGKYGLISASYHIPYYNYQLQPREVASLSKKVTGQLQQVGLRKLLYFTKIIAKDGDLFPYLDTMQRACQAASVNFITITMPDDSYDGYIRARLTIGA